jgi:hypothetical protein
MPDAVTDLTSVVGAYPVDIDGDGHIDLAVLRYGENVLLRGLGDCRFERANEAWGYDGGDAWTTAFSAKWEGSATLPTLAFGNYLDMSHGQQNATCADNELVRPKDGVATYAEPIPLTPGWCTLSILFSDWNRSGRGDLRMTNDRHYYLDGEEQLWHVAEGEPPRLYTHDEGWQQMRIWGMGIASYDLTGDGLPEVFLTSQGDNKLQTLADGSAQPHYRDIALQAGVTAPRPYAGGDVLPSTAWHAEFQDVNNDGFVDLFVTKGNVEAMPDFAAKDPSNLMLGNADGTFTESGEAAGIVSFTRGRGAAVVDLNLTGCHLVVVHRTARRAPQRRWGANGPADGGGSPFDWNERVPTATRSLLDRGRTAIGRPSGRLTVEDTRRARLDPLRSGRRRRGRDPHSLAGRSDGTVAHVAGGSIRDDRARSDGTADLGPAGLIGHGRDDERATRGDLAPRLRQHVRRVANDPRRDLSRSPGAAPRACG